MSNFVSLTYTHFVLVIFVQWGIEEAQLGLQHRDEVIHQVGREMPVGGSDSPKSPDSVINIDLSLEFNMLTLTAPRLSLLEHDLFQCVFEIEKLTAKTCWGNSRGVFNHHKGKSSWITVQFGSKVQKHEVKMCFLNSKFKMNKGWTVSTVSTQRMCLIW